VLQKLAEEPSLSLNELAARTLTHQSSVSVVVSRLVDAGLVSRSTSRSDQRRVVLSLSTKGRALVRNSPDAAQHRLISAIEGLPAKNRRSLALQLEALVRRAGIGGEEAALFFEEGPPAVSASRRKGVLHREPA
jgi:DNA-binding MarR family transcriptional regulator